MVKSNNVYSPQNFVEALTGECYIFDGHDVIENIHKLLRQHGIEDDECETKWDYPLNEISEALEVDADVVLVDVSGFASNDEWVLEYRWFEVPSDFTDDSIPNNPQFIKHNDIVEKYTYPKDTRKQIAKDVDEKMRYMGSCPNERDIILDIIEPDNNHRDAVPHCSTDCGQTECKAYNRKECMED